MIPGSTRVDCFGLGNGCCYAYYFLTRPSWCVDATSLCPCWDTHPSNVHAPCKSHSGLDFRVALGSTIGSIPGSGFRDFGYPTSHETGLAFLPTPSLPAE